MKKIVYESGQTSMMNFLKKKKKTPLPVCMSSATDVVVDQGYMGPIEVQLFLTWDP